MFNIKRIGAFLLFYIISISSVFAQIKEERQIPLNPKFSHQFRYLDDDDYQQVDTLFGNLKNYHKWNGTSSDLYNYSVLGSMGNALNPLTLEEQNDIWTYSDHKAFTPYFNSQSKIPFYLTKSALTEASYWQGYDVGQLFKIYNTQNIGDHFNYYLAYNRLNDLGFYQHNRVKQSSFTFSANYDFRRYVLEMYFLSEKLEVEENGGIVSDSSFIENLETNRVLLDVNLDNDTREMKNREFFARQQFDLAVWDQGDSIIKEASYGLFVGHDFKYSRRTDFYSGVANIAYYNNYFNGTDTYVDSSYYYSYSNSLYLRGLLGDKTPLKLKLGVKSLITDYRSEMIQFSTNNLGLIGEVDWQKSIVRTKLNLDYIFSGGLEKTLNLDLNLEVRPTEEFSFGIFYQYQSRLPNFYYWTNFADNYAWNAPKEMELLNRFKLFVKWKGGGVMGELLSSQNFLFLDEQSIPQQDLEVNYAKVQVEQNFKFWKGFMNLDNRITYQEVLEGATVLPLPRLITRNALYFNFRILKALRVSTGAEMKYFTSYRSRSYIPALGLFSLEGSSTIGSYPLVDLFFNVKIKKATVFFKIEHGNQGLMGYDYFAAPRYPFPDRVIRVGLTWRFFN